LECASIATLAATLADHAQRFRQRDDRGSMLQKKYQLSLFQWVRSEFMLHSACSIENIAAQLLQIQKILNALNPAHGVTDQ
jgi:hypothetical protein